MFCTRNQTKLLAGFFLLWALLQLVFWSQFLRDDTQTGIDTLQPESLQKLNLQLRKELANCRKSRPSFTTSKEFPKIYLITPTYARPAQKADLVRLSQTLLLVPNIFWIIVEDSSEKTSLVTRLLRESGLPNAHLNVLTPKYLKPKPKEPKWKKPRGVFQRNLGLNWIRSNLNVNYDTGVVYFADDDNTYHIDLFEEMRYTKKVSVWPVALSGNIYVERPFIKDNKVTGWSSVFRPERPLPIDMAGFAINLNLVIRNPNVNFSPDSPVGYQESSIVGQLIDIKNELEAKAENCTKVLVWHTRTQSVNLSGEKLLKKLNKLPTNHDVEI